MDKLSYALGLGIGRQLAQMGAADIDTAEFAAAINDVIKGNDLKMTNREAQAIVQDYFARQEERINAERAESGKAAKAAGEEYLAENARKDGVTVLPSGLQYMVLREGSGRRPSSTAACAGASRRSSACSRSSPAGPRDCSSCRRAPSTASSYPTSSATARRGQAAPSRHTQP